MPAEHFTDLWGSTLVKFSSSNFCILSYENATMGNSIPSLGLENLQANNGSI